MAILGKCRGLSVGFPAAAVVSGFRPSFAAICSINSFFCVSFMFSTFGISGSVGICWSFSSQEALKEASGSTSMRGSKEFSVGKACSLGVVAIAVPEVEAI